MTQSASKKIVYRMQPNEQTWWDLPVFMEVVEGGTESMGFCPEHGARATANAGWMYTGVPETGSMILMFDNPHCLECGKEITWRKPQTPRRKKAKATQ